MNTCCDARYRGPGFIPLASIILLASGERRKSRKTLAVDDSCNTIGCIALISLLKSISGPVLRRLNLLW